MVKKIEFAPDCPKCETSDTHVKRELSKEFDYPEANCWCDNCEIEFYTPIEWYSIENWRNRMKIF